MPHPDADFPPTFCYRLLARKGAGVVPRVIEHFAKRDLVPARFDCRAGTETLAIDVEVEGLDEAAARHIARCLSGMVEMERVALTEKTVERSRARA
jgi:hypothetical protein